MVSYVMPPLVTLKRSIVAYMGMRTLLKLVFGKLNDVVTISDKVQCDFLDLRNDSSAGNLFLRLLTNSSDLCTSHIQISSCLPVEVYSHFFLL